MTLSPSDLVLCAATLPTASFRERAAAAAAAGFRGISLFVEHYRRARAEGFSDADLRAILADHGLVVADVDPLLTWLPGVERVNAFFEADEADFYEVADALRARSLNCAVVVPLALDAVADAFAGLCERAARHGLLVHLEFLPWTCVPDLATALRVVESAGHGGITLDAWHHFRSGGSSGALPVERILSVQLCDAPAAAEADPIEETLHRRLLPGAGALDLVGLLRALRGSPAPLGVEIFSDALAVLPPLEAARRAGEAVRSVLARV